MLGKVIVIIFIVEFCIFVLFMPFIYVHYILCIVSNHRYNLLYNRVEILILFAHQYTVYKNSLFWKRSVGVGKSAFSHYGLLS